jgi:hypothetical protein
MITVSDNLETGIIVDIVTGAPNIVNLTKSSDPRFAPWVRIQLELLQRQLRDAQFCSVSPM